MPWSFWYSHLSTLASAANVHDKISRLVPGVTVSLGACGAPAGVADSSSLAEPTRLPVATARMR